jgi:4-carboxymuconolactone decarboxylase
MSRIPELQKDELTEDQARVYDAVLASRGALAGPFRIWLHSPEFADRAQRLGEFVRYRTVLGPRLSELAILIVARHHNCQVEWTLHEPFARGAGLDQNVIEAIRDGRGPAFQREDERALHAFCAELLANHAVRDGTFQTAVAHVGSQGIVELTGLVGYYALVAMTLNAFRVPLPEGTAPLLTNCPTV